MGLDMSAYLLFWHEPSSRFERTYSWIHKQCGIYGLEPLVIDPTRTWPIDRPDLPQLVYYALEDVLADDRFAGHTFVWLDPKATQALEDFEHPEDAVVYCVGSDMSGFGGLEWEGPRVRILGEGGEYFAAVCVPILCYDRWLYLQGRRT